MREAAVAHDLAVVWWRLGMRRAAQQPGGPAGQASTPGQPASLVPAPQRAGEQQAEGGAQQQAAGEQGEGPRAQDGAQPPAAAEAQAQWAQQAQPAQQAQQPAGDLQWVTDRVALKQLNFPPHM